MQDGWTRKQIQDYMNTKLKPLNFTLSETIEAKVNLSLITSRAANIIGLIKMDDISLDCHITYEF